MAATILVFLATALALSPGVDSRTFYVKNSCSYTVWPAVFTDMHASKVKPDIPTGWEAPPGSLFSFTIPANWTAGRIWGRRDCNFTGANANQAASCSTGGCIGGLQCDPSVGTGVPPATLGEWTIDADGLDNYDVSIVDGSNIPLSITNNKGCPVASCPKDLGADCPAPLKYGNNGCLSACAANLDKNQGNSPNCCTGQYNTNATCPSSGIQYFSHFQSGCPEAYVYAYDDATALKTCASNLQADYTLTFCP